MSYLIRTIELNLKGFKTLNLKGLQKFEIEMVNIGLSMRPTLILVRVQEGKQSLSSNPIGITFVIQYLPASELLTEPDIKSIITLKFTE